MSAVPEKVGLNVDRLSSGYVIDHIKAGQGMRIYQHLKLDELGVSVALIRNVKSSKYGSKDIIKIAGLIKIDMDMLGYIDPNITVITVENNGIVNKQTLKLPDRLTDVIICKNPRCITSTEPSMKHEFQLTDRERKLYRCVYCEQESR